MAIYEIKCRHHKPEYRKGDLEDTDNNYIYSSHKTRKEANEAILKLRRDAERSGYTIACNIVKRGEGQTELIVYTRYKWINENSGEEHTESYYYRVVKK